jgi:tetratricopeptide (TPR) repeat protein
MWLKFARLPILVVLVAVVWGPTVEGLAVRFNSTGYGHYENGLQALEERRWPEAAVNFEKAINEDPCEASYHFNLGVAYQSLLDSQATNPVSGMTRGALFERQKTSFHRASVLAPNDYDLVWTYAMTLLSAERYGIVVDWEAVSRTWTKCLDLPYAKRSPANRAGILYQLARAEFACGRHKTARMYCEEGLELYPLSIRIRQLLEEASMG